jgi:hypothetical protein
MPITITADEDGSTDWRKFLPSIIVRNERTGENLRVTALSVDVERASGSQPEAPIESGDQLTSVAVKQW